MIRVVIVNEVRLVGDIIAADLRRQPDMEVQGVATSIEEGLGYVPGCNVLLVSHGLPDRGGLALTRVVTHRDPGIKTLILGLRGGPQTVLTYIEAGAAGYVQPDDSFAELLHQIRAAARGDALLGPEMTSALLMRVSELARSGGGRPLRLTQLTSREREVLGLLGQGLSNRDIAGQLTIEVGTVKNHVHSILRKLNVTSRRDLSEPVA